MKRYLIILVIGVLLACFLPGLSGQGDIGLDGQPCPQAAGAIVIDQENQDVLYEENARQMLYPASTTKILTALLVIEHVDLDEIVTVGDEICMVGTDGSRAGLKTGEQIAIRDLLAGLLLPSGNDAAYTLAVQTARRTSGNHSMNSREAVSCFAEMMNRRARQIGANNSHFVNPDGYHDEQHYTTAFDMALIAREAMKKSIFQEIVNKKSHRMPGKNGIWENTNQLLDPESPYYYPASTGIKTGYTKPAGYCLVSSADIEGKGLIAVVLNSSKDGQWKDSIQLLEYGTIKAMQLRQREQRLYIVITSTIVLLFVFRKRKGRKRRIRT